MIINISLGLVFELVLALAKAGSTYLVLAYCTR